MFKRITFVLLISLLLVITSPSTHAASFDFIKWHTTNIQYLRGWDYQGSTKERNIITFEHAHGWTYGDFYTFIDTTRFSGGESNIYGEFSPRLSLSKTTGKNFSYGIVKDILLSGTLEEAEKSGRTWLGGVAVDLDIPGFKFFKTNLYLRDDVTRNGETYQVTLSWNRPFKIDETRYLIEGFADFAGAEGSGKEEHQLIVPRFLVNVGDLAGYKLDNLWAGIEYSYWHNKFGTDGVTESHPQVQFKWVF